MAIKTITMPVSELSSEQGAARWDGMVNDYEYRVRMGDLIPQFQLDFEGGFAIGTFTVFKIDAMRNAPVPATQEQLASALKAGDEEIERKRGLGGPRGLVR